MTDYSCIHRIFYGDRQGRLWRKLSMAQQYSMTRNGIHSALCFARSIHIPKIRAEVSMTQKIPSKTSSWRDWASLLVMYLRNFRMASFSPGNGKSMDCRPPVYAVSLRDRRALLLKEYSARYIDRYNGRALRDRMRLAFSCPLVAAPPQLTIVIGIGANLEAAQSIASISAKMSLPRSAPTKC
jgi:hypothetical protein